MPDRYTTRRIINDLIDMLLEYDISKQEIVSYIDSEDFYSKSDKEYFDINWLYEED